MKDMLRSHTVEGFNAVVKIEYLGYVIPNRKRSLSQLKMYHSCREKVEMAETVL